MPEVRVLFFQDDEGSVPMAQWIDRLDKKPREKCYAWIERLEQVGHELHRPYADTLRDGIHELRVRFGRINYRMLYFFHGSDTVVLTHGFVKEREVPAKEIDRALRFKREFESDPETHTFRWEPQDG